MPTHPWSPTPPALKEQSSLLNAPIPIRHMRLDDLSRLLGAILATDGLDEIAFWVCVWREGVSYH